MDSKLIIKEVTDQGSIFTSFPQTILDNNTSPIEEKIFEIDGNKILLLYNVFSENECKQIIHFSELSGFESLSHIYEENYRNNLRVMVDDKFITDTWFKRMESAIHSMSEFWDTNEFICMNQRLRICKYNQGGIFALHYDSPIFRNGLQSTYTVMAYLNDLNEGEGGSTRFFSEIEPDSPPIYLKPKQGSVVIFNHNVAHDGERLKGHVKYIMRSDIMIPLKSMNIV